MSDNAVAARTPTKTVADFFEKHKGQLAAALPKHLNADRMSRLALTAFSTNKGLQGCDPTSLFGAVVLACQMGLEIGVGGQAFIVPYKDRRSNKVIATFVPGWQGIVDLVNRTNRATVWTGAVFEGDDFDYAMGDRPFVKHKPCGEDDPAKITHTYAIGRVNGAEWPVIDVWPLTKIRKHFAKNNKVGDRHYAHQHWEMYSRKLPLLQVCKYMPRSVELTAAMQAEFAAQQGSTIKFDGEIVTIVDAPETEPQDITPPANAKEAARQRAAKLKPEHRGPLTFAEFAEAIKSSSNGPAAAELLEQAELLVPANQYGELVDLVVSIHGNADPGDAA